jgi:thioredoxin:protein disulfide reductase
LCLSAGVLLALPILQRRSRAAGKPWRAVAAAILAVIGLLQWVGAASGGRDPLQPLSHLSARLGGAEGSGMPRFATVRNVDELDAALRASDRPVMLDFYADWCVSCKEMERFTFTDRSVQAKLGGAVLLKADVTKNSADDRALLKRFGLFGPPGTIFFDRQGREIAGTRVIGFQNTARFLETLRSAGL